MTDKQLPPLPTPKFTETIRGVPCITVTEHEHLMREYALQARAQVQSDPSWWMRETDEGAEWTDTAPLVLSGWTPLYTAPQPAQATQAEVTDSMIREAFLANGFTIKDGHSDLKPYVYAAARAILALRPTQVNTLAGCNCRWDGDNQVEWCELHLTHKEAIHEWAERAKSAEQKLALRPVQVPMTGSQKTTLAWNWMTEAALDEYLSEYEMRGETADGLEASYSPNDGEKALIKDAVMGFLHEAEEAAWRTINGITSQAKKEGE